MNEIVESFLSDLKLLVVYRSDSLTVFRVASHLARIVFDHQTKLASKADSVICPRGTGARSSGQDRFCKASPQEAVMVSYSKYGRDVIG